MQGAAQIERVVGGFWGMYILKNIWGSSGNMLVGGGLLGIISGIESRIRHGPKTCIAFRGSLTKVACG